MHCKMVHYRARGNSTVTEGQRHIPKLQWNGSDLDLKNNNTKAKEERLKSAIQLFIDCKTAKFPLHGLRLHLETGDDASTVLSTMSASR